MQEYHKLTSKDAVVKSAQATINILCDCMRKVVDDNMDEFRGDTIKKVKIESIGTTQNTFQFNL